VPVYVVDSRLLLPRSSRYCPGASPGIWINRRRRNPWSTCSASRSHRRAPPPGAHLRHHRIFVAENAERLRSGFRFPARIPHWSIRSIARRGCTAASVRSSHPEAFFPQSRAEVVQFTERTAFPVMVKPIEDRLPEDAWGQPSAWFTADRNCSTSMIGPRIAAAEHVAARDIPAVRTRSSCSTVLRRQLGVSGRITGKKLRQFPAYTGPRAWGL